jgi:hypothetical protein
MLNNQQRKLIARKTRAFLKNHPKIKKFILKYALDLDQIVLKKDEHLNTKPITITDKETQEKLKQYQLIVNEYNKLIKNEIIIYFFGKMGQTYQIKQWIDTFIELHKKHRIIVVVRYQNVQEYFTKILPFPIKYCNTIDDVLTFYDTVEPKSIIYINNGFKNFQSLIYEKALHVHINHGESDKASDHSNQVKGYDYIFVHGPNGYNNYMKYLIKLNPKQLIITGRPQLDFISPITLNTFNKKVILYAPTWEATHRSMRYTSVDIYGEQIVNKILEDNKYFLIYKPHPNLGANDKNVLRIHKSLMQKIDSHKYAITITNEDVNNIYPIVDCAIFDMSSIMTDYLNVNKPFLLADVFDPLVHTISDYNVLKGCNKLTTDNIEYLIEIIDKEINDDKMKEKRQKIKELYLGDYKQGESIQKFINSISQIITQRDQEILKKDIEG